MSTQQISKILQQFPNDPEILYNAEKQKLEDKLQQDIKGLNWKLEDAKRIPSFAWFIFKPDHDKWNFFKMLNNNYIDDIRKVVKEWLEYTDEILKKPKKDFVLTHNVPVHINMLINDVSDKFKDAIMFGGDRKLEFLKQYIAFYEQTIEPCFELQKQITQRKTELKKCFENNPLTKGDVDLRYFIWLWVSLTEYCETELTKQYYKSKKILKRHRIKIKLIARISKAFKWKSQKPLI